MEGSRTACNCREWFLGSGTYSLQGTQASQARSAGCREFFCALHSMPALLCAHGIHCRCLSMPVYCESDKTPATVQWALRFTANYDEAGAKVSQNRKRCRSRKANN